MRISKANPMAFDTPSGRKDIHTIHDCSGLDADITDVPAYNLLHVNKYSMLVQ
jgi:hypothetical protein